MRKFCSYERRKICQHVIPESEEHPEFQALNLDEHAKTSHDETVKYGGEESCNTVENRNCSV
jgi:hypothetical protein